MDESSSREGQDTLALPYLLFVIRPADLLRLLLLLAAEDQPRLHAPQFPPDTRIVEAFYQEERDRFVSVLASQFFDPVTAVPQPNGRLSGAWNELLFELSEVEDPSLIPDQLWSEVEPGDVSDDAPARPAAEEALHRAGEKRWCAFFVRPDQVLVLLQNIAEGRACPLRDPATLPPDARLLFATWDQERQAFGLILSSEDFDPVTPTPTEHGTVRLALPERTLDIALNDNFDDGTQADSAPD